MSLLESLLYGRPVAQIISRGNRMVLFEAPLRKTLTVVTTTPAGAQTAQPCDAASARSIFAWAPQFQESVLSGTDSRAGVARQDPISQPRPGVVPVAPGPFYGQNRPVNPISLTMLRALPQFQLGDQIPGSYYDPLATGSTIRSSRDIRRLGVSMKGRRV